MKGKAKIIIENEGQLLLLKPHDKKKMTLIGGSVDKKEKPAQAVIREAHEEAGVDIQMSDLTFFYSCEVKVGNKSGYFYCFLLENKDVIFELKEKHKFKYVDWIPIHVALKKLRGIERKMVEKFIREKSFKLKYNDKNNNLAS